MGADQDYVLGTHDAEIERLGLQHRVWRAETLSAWRCAGMSCGSRVLDVGSGPGYATVDAAEIVGPHGAVAAVDRSERFLDIARQQTQARGLSWVQFYQADLSEDRIRLAGFDIAWCRWVASFVRSPRQLVENIATALRVGGKAVFHEYVHYASWRVSPPNPMFERFVTEVMASWRASGGEPDIALDLPALLQQAGMKVIATRPIVHAIGPSDFIWQWLASFVDSGLNRLVELHYIEPDWASSVRHAFQQLERNPASIMLSPTVLELIAERAA
jgi:SAM-dependent methyltransferase